MKVAVVVFPGSNCDRDAAWAWEQVVGGPATLVWHDQGDLAGAEAVIIPGGFAYGDYLRAGALCRFAPVMRAVQDAAAQGMPVLGICNGFQILCEAALLPGALDRNAGLAFICDQVFVRVENCATAWTGQLQPGQVLSLPIAHAQGRYWLPEPERQALVAGGGVVFRYSDAHGVVGQVNPNGSLDSIAGVCNKSGNVVGMMPHPERASEALLGSVDGREILRSALIWAQGGRRLA